MGRGGIEMGGKGKKERGERTKYEGELICTDPLLTLYQEYLYRFS